MKTSLLLLLTFGCIGCNDNSVGVIAPTELFPLKHGFAIFNYKVQNFDSLGQTYDTSSTIESVGPDTLLNGRRLYQYFGLVSLNLIDSQFFLLTGSDGIYQYVTPQDTAYLLYKFPAQVNDVYTSFRDTITVEALNQSITTDAGSFNCIVYKQRTNLYYGSSPKYWWLTTYVAYGIGKVRYELTIADPSIKVWTKMRLMRVDLVKYTNYPLAG